MLWNIIISLKSQTCVIYPCDTRQSGGLPGKVFVVAEHSSRCNVVVSVKINLMQHNVRSVSVFFKLIVCGNKNGKNYAPP